jgi:hypothetical protein
MNFKKILETCKDEVPVMLLVSNIPNDIIIDLHEFIRHNDDYNQTPWSTNINSQHIIFNGTDIYIIRPSIEIIRWFSTKYVFYDDELDEFRRFVYECDRRIKLAEGR